MKLSKAQLTAVQSAYENGRIYLGQYNRFTGRAITAATLGALEKKGLVSLVDYSDFAWEGRIIRWAELTDAGRAALAANN